MVKRVRLVKPIGASRFVLTRAQVYFVALGGTVQGTYFTRQKAQAYGLTGWCRNTPDNKASARAPFKTQTLFSIGMLTRSDQVEGEVQGEEASVDKLLKDVGQGPSGATVVRLTQETRDVVADEAGFAKKQQQHTTS
ncbi:hypothetical protein MY4824_007663 [Beauveria thailandica]